MTASSSLEDSQYELISEGSSDDDAHTASLTESVASESGMDTPDDLSIIDTQDGDEVQLQLPQPLGGHTSDNEQAIEDSESDEDGAGIHDSAPTSRCEHGPFSAHGRSSFLSTLDFPPFPLGDTAGQEIRAVRTLATFSVHDGLPAALRCYNVPPTHNQVALTMRQTMASKQLKLNWRKVYHILFEEETSEEVNVGGLRPIKMKIRQTTGLSPEGKYIPYRDPYYDSPSCPTPDLAVFYTDAFDGAEVPAWFSVLRKLMADELVPCLDISSSPLYGQSPLYGPDGRRVDPTSAVATREMRLCVEARAASTSSMDEDATPQQSTVHHQPDSSPLILDVLPVPLSYLQDTHPDALNRHLTSLMHPHSSVSAKSDEDGSIANESRGWREHWVAIKARRTLNWLFGTAHFLLLALVDSTSAWLRVASRLVDSAWGDHMAPMVRSMEKRVEITANYVRRKKLLLQGVQLALGMILGTFTILVVHLAFMGVTSQLGGVLRISRQDAVVATPTPAAQVASSAVGAPLMTPCEWHACGYAFPGVKVKGWPQGCGEGAGAKVEETRPKGQEKDLGRSLQEWAHKELASYTAAWTGWEEDVVAEAAAPVMKKLDAWSADKKDGVALSSGTGAKNTNNDVVKDASAPKAKAADAASSSSQQQKQKLSKEHQKQQQQLATTPTTALGYLQHLMFPNAAGIGAPQVRDSIALAHRNARALRARVQSEVVRTWETGLMLVDRVRQGELAAAAAASGAAAKAKAKAQREGAVGAAGRASKALGSFFGVDEWRASAAREAGAVRKGWEEGLSQARRRVEEVWREVPVERPSWGRAKRNAVNLQLDGCGGGCGGGYETYAGDT
ncbi:hypothetical protein BDY21DRAFT_360099 [Lineolata rhizophorae]|uniref:Uncharacterized protein n=1 Tax=Lineolata rhizophorae TaxID=578093 RepID=A0A6A6PE52_9PEZI|nr:hypothetical protein BDY21DRAFT_360099 [Lineolata rhizophorae]